MRISKAGSLILAAISLNAAGCRPAVADPTGFRGKSVVVAWTEERMQRILGMADYRPAVRQGGFSAYISSAGRVFSRSSMARGGASGSTDRVGNADQISVRVQGRTLMAVQHGGSGGARHIEVTFDESFASCSAKVIRGKAEGAKSIIANSTISPGQKIEIASVRTSGESCSVKNGNVFGNE